MGMGWDVMETVAYVLLSLILDDRVINAIKNATVIQFIAKPTGFGIFISNNNADEVKTMFTVLREIIDKSKTKYRYFKKDGNEYILIPVTKEMRKYFEEQIRGVVSGKEEKEG